MPPAVRFLPAAVRDLARLDKPDARRIVKRINWLVSNHDTARHDRLSGDLAGFLKLRAGDFRIIYELLEAEDTLIIHAIGHRRDIYRKR